MKLSAVIPGSLLLAVISISCGNNSSPEAGTSETARTETSIEQPDSLSRWVSWAEESGEGLWEDGSHRFNLEEVRIYGGQEFPPFYNVEGFAFRGDTMYVSDPTDQSLAAVSLSTGERLWKAGEAGEGPGHFSGIGEVAAGDSLIAVCDTGNGRVSLVNPSGEFAGEISIGCPMDVMWKGDSLLVLSLAEEKPLNIYSSDGEFLGSCGQLPEEMGLLSYINRHLHGLVTSDGNVLVISRFVSGIWKIDPETGDTEVFSDISFPQGDIVNDLARGEWMVLCRDIFYGPDGMVNIILPVFNEEGGSIADGGEMQNTTVIHRYDMEGRYLDSWAMNGTVGIVLMHDGLLYSADRYADGVVASWDAVR